MACQDDGRPSARTPQVIRLTLTKGYYSVLQHPPGKKDQELEHTYTLQAEGGGTLVTS